MFINTSVVRLNGSIDGECIFLERCDGKLHTLIRKHGEPHTEKITPAEFLHKLRFIEVRMILAHLKDMMDEIRRIRKVKRGLRAPHS